MSGQLTIRGVPDRLKQDAWWLSGAPNPSQTSPRPVPGLGARISDGKAALLALLILIALADISFWGHIPALSWAIFSLGLSAAMIAFKPIKASRREWAMGLAFALACNLPMVEHSQPLAYGFSLGGIAVLLAWVMRGPALRLAGVLSPFVSASTDGLLITHASRTAIPPRLNP
ncbi:MAG: hypothetical protein AAFO68_06225 [Pseudomonadota bacterium]